MTLRRIPCKGVPFTEEEVRAWVEDLLDGKKTLWATSGDTLLAVDSDLGQVYECRVVAVWETDDGR